MVYPSRLGTKWDRPLGFAGLTDGARRESVGEGDPHLMSSLRGVAEFPERWIGQEELGANSSNMMMMGTMGLPCGKELGSGVHALLGRGDRTNQFGVIKNVPMFGLLEARLCTTAGGPVRRYQTGHEAKGLAG